jgi:hypothetical protein
MACWCRDRVWERESGNHDHPITGKHHFVFILSLTILLALGFANSIYAGSSPLEAGDSNQNYEFDQHDLVEALQAARYLTGQPATWEEGDWDGAPGGFPGSPPPGSGFFDQLDIIAAINAGEYMAGAYSVGGTPTPPPVLVSSGGVAGDEQTSIVYYPSTGEIRVDAPASAGLTSINIQSDSGIFTGDAASNLGGTFDIDADDTVFKAQFGASFSSITFGNIALSSLTEGSLLADLRVSGSLEGGGALGTVDLIVTHALRAGDSNQNFEFDQHDLVLTLQAARYLTGQPASWEEGDWDGAPGGFPGSPPPGSGFFDQLDIIAAINAGEYMAGAYSAGGTPTPPPALVSSGGAIGDEQTSIVYFPLTGEIQVDAPASVGLTSINIQSDSGIFTGDAASNLGGSFDIDADDTVFKAQFGASFSSISFGNIAASSLTEGSLLADLRVSGSLEGGGALGIVDLVIRTENIYANGFEISETRAGALKWDQPLRGGGEVLRHPENR